MKQSSVNKQSLEEALRFAAEEWRITFDSITDPIAIYDNDFRIVRLNKSFAGHYGNNDINSCLGRRCYQVIHSADEPPPECPRQQIRMTHQPVTREHYDDQRGRYLEISMVPLLNDAREMVGVVEILKDVTERKQMEENLLVTDRMVSLGEMASGLAHEVNNPLTGVIGFTQLLLDNQKLPPELRPDLEIVAGEAKRAAEIVRKLLSFARGGESVYGPVEVNAVIDAVLQVREYELRVKNIAVETRLDDCLPLVKADALELQQVFINLIINAEFFMFQSHGEGRLVITTRQQGDGVEIIVADDGPGISRSKVSQIFSPFFTTKKNGQGTGLGLSICRGIINRHGGCIRVESEEGTGTSFTVELPVASEIAV